MVIHSHHSDVLTPSFNIRRTWIRVRVQDTHTQTLQSCTLPKEPCPRTFLNSNWRGSAFSDPSFTWWVMLISLNCMSSCQIQTRSYSERTSAQWSVRNQQKNVVSSHFYLLICTKRYIKKQAKKEDAAERWYITRIFAPADFQLSFWLLKPIPARNSNRTIIYELD